ncbi:pseudouridine synthase [Daedalea quercina L-15889]|uniref:Pseudouridine synthase n=1 Tax=Daedalea quercina L-15889 TaxID=1314783 RepID=A0A165P184_9APHY|nr:pseudouridine synthase [Daedalea quercina L-15889]
MASDPSIVNHGSVVQRPGLKKIPPYWYPYTTMAKGRWLGREILEVVSTEFRDRSMEYYRYALESGVTTINGKVAKPETIVKNGDRIENVVHRHEPPVTSTPVRIVHHDKERGFIIVDKPGSIPVHAAGRYFRNSLVEILKNDFGFQKVYTINRLDRLTSGMMIVPLNAQLANILSKEFADSKIQKEYIARCKGKFPQGEVTCDQPLLTVDRQMGLNIVHPEGKPAKTIFRRLHYDSNTHTSVVHCRPLTGRSHQIRVHLQYLGYPIANDPIYSETKIWGEQLGKEGVDLTPSKERAAPAPPEESGLSAADNPELLSKKSAGLAQQDDPSSSVNSNVSADQPNGHGVESASGSNEALTSAPKLLPRETGHDIGMGSPVPLSAELVGIITRLRNMKDEDEDWSRWRDVVFRVKGALSPHGVNVPLPPQNKRKRGGPVQMPVPQHEADETVGASRGDDNADAADNDMPQMEEQRPQLTVEEALVKLESYRTPPLSVLSPPTDSPSLLPTPLSDSSPPPTAEASAEVDAASYCPECFLPLHPDPRPERLYIFLHALRYTTSLGSFETEMPEWAAEGWTWDRS